MQFRKLRIKLPTKPENKHKLWLQKPVSIHVADLNMHLRPRPQVHSVLYIVFHWETVGSMWLHPVKPPQVARNSAAFSILSVYTLSLFKLQTHTTELCNSPQRSWSHACVFTQKTFSVLQFLCGPKMRVYMMFIILWLLADITGCRVKCRWAAWFLVLVEGFLVKWMIQRKLCFPYQVHHVREKKW